MTRINAGIHPSELCDQHLIAEYRELPRIRALAVKYDGRPIPHFFTLGTGHMRFFIDKGAYLERRFNAILKTMDERGFKHQHSWREWPPELNGDWKPAQRERDILKKRIAESMGKMKRMPTKNGVRCWMLILKGENEED